VSDEHRDVESLDRDYVSAGGILEDYHPPGAVVADPRDEDRERDVDAVMRSYFR
jgi:hypothetical protein